MAVTAVDPFDSQMPFPLDLRLVKDTLSGRDGIPANARFWGLLCFVRSEGLQGTLFVLGQNLTNSDWQQVWPVVLPESTDYQSLIVNTSTPTSGLGSDGDMWLRQTGDTVEVYQKLSGSWGLRGTLDVGGDIPSIEDSRLTLDETSSTLNGYFPDMPIGGRAYKSGLGMVYKKETPTEWSTINTI